MHKNASSARLHGFLLISGLGILVWSGISPRDRLTWLMEVGPAIAGVVVLVATYRRFRLSDVAYVLIWVHAIVLMLGGHWTYAEMPVFNWLRDGLGLARNYYDRVGHLVQGFVPAILAREILLRTSPLRRGKWLSVLVVCVCMSISATYELIEWTAALLLGQSADAFLGTQGDVWDTQWDMFLCLVGSVVALATMGGVHDRSLGRLGAET